MSTDDPHNDDDPLALARREVERASQHYYQTSLQLGLGIDQRTKQFVIERCEPFIRGPYVLERLSSYPALRGIWTNQHPISSVPGRESLVLRVPGAGRGRSLAINTHLDVVPEGDPALWTHPTICLA